MNEFQSEQLRKDLIDYYGSAMFMGFGSAMINILDIEKATEEQLLIIAEREHFDLRKYTTY